jgi:hypothetical protein
MSDIVSAALLIQTAALMINTLFLLVFGYATWKEVRGLAKKNGKIY